MLTRRSRKEGVVSPSTPNDADILPKSKRSKTPSSRKSKSVEKKIRTRSKSANKKIVPLKAKVVLKRFDSSPETEKKVPKKKMSVELDDESVSGKSQVMDRSSPFVERLNNLSAEIPNKFVYEDRSDEKQPAIINYSKINLSPVEFGGLFGNLILAISLPILVILTKIAIKTKGKLIPFPRGYLRYANYYDQDVFIWTIAIVGLQLLISLIPLAKRSEGLPGSDFRIYYYRFSGFINLIIGVLIVAAMDYYKCPINFILEIVTKKTIPHVVASVLFAFIISIILYAKANFTKQIDKLDNSNFIQKLFIGTTTNPTLGPINIKLALYRYSLLMTILFNSLVIMDSLKNPVNVQLYFVTGLQIFYALDKLIFEFNLLSSFYLRKEKDGYWTIIQQFLEPIIKFLPIQILFAENLPVNYIILSISSILFLFGYVCQRYSDLIKYQYETNSKYAKISPGFKTSLTLNGRRIFVSGLYSYIRYPNYLGTIIIHLALILPSFEPTLVSLQTSWPILVYPLYYILTLSYRSIRVSSYCQLRYGSSWDHQYAVKWNLIPKIF